MTVKGSLTLSKGNIDIDNGLTLTAAGSALTMASGTAFTTPSTGWLKLDAIVPPLTFTASGSVTLVNVEIADTVVLAGSFTSMTITGIFYHTGGDLNFADRDLIIQGTYTRTAGTYSATTGYLRIQGASFDKGDNHSHFTIPNLSIESDGSFAATGSDTVIVLSNFDLNSVNPSDVFTHTVSGSPTLAVASGANVNYYKGNLDVPPIYLGTIVLNLVGAGGIDVPNNVWPLAPSTLVTTLNVDASGTYGLGSGTHVVNSQLDLTAGGLNIGSGRALSLADNLSIKVVAGTLTTSFPGAVNYGSGISVSYEINTTGAGAYSTAAELPPSVSSLTFARTGNIANGEVVVKSPVLVNG
ncbi:MAG: hypothetical protein ACPL1K_05675, partial [Candidatus Kryptoniota bacterium]